MTGGGFYVILDGEAKVVIDGQERARLHRGDFFGEISILTDDAPVAADVIATSLLRCLIIPDNELKAFLLKQPSVMYRMPRSKRGGCEPRTFGTARRASVPAGRLRRRAGGSGPAGCRPRTASPARGSAGAR